MRTCLIVTLLVLATMIMWTGVQAQESEADREAVMRAWAEANDRQNRRAAMDALDVEVMELVGRQVLPDDDTGQAQITDFVARHIPPLSVPETRGAWERKAATIRQEVLKHVIYRGIPQEAIDADVEVTWGEVIDDGHDYVIQTLTFEGYPPGVAVPALLYRPRKLEGEVPVVLNPIGHFAIGMAEPFDQVRCINLARRGMMALVFDWVGFGQMRHSDDAFNPHNELVYLDLVGTSGTGAFYLTARRALDVLLSHPHADATRVAVTGLSGGGWQTILLAALDERVTLAAPVSGYIDLGSRLQPNRRPGDKEQNAADLIKYADYTHLTALMFPRPILLIHNARDCCFHPEDARQALLEPVGAMYEQYGEPNGIRMHVNERPGNHNYEEDNRRAFYRFISEYFYPDEDISDEEIISDDEILAESQLKVDMPEDALLGSEAWTVHAERVMDELPRVQEAPVESQEMEQWGADLRTRLKEVLRYQEESATIASRTPIETDSWYTAEEMIFEVGDDWRLPAIVFTPPDPVGTIIAINYLGKQHRGNPVSFGLIPARRRVILVDLLFNGEMNVEGHGQHGGGHNSQHAAHMDTVGRRPLGVQVSQLIAVRRAVAAEYDDQPIAVIPRGRESTVTALLAAALEPSDDHVSLRHLPDSLKDLIRQRVAYPREPMLFCFGLLEVADIEHMRALVPEDRVLANNREITLF